MKDDLPEFETLSLRDCIGAFVLFILFFGGFIFGVFKLVAWLKQ